MRAPQDAIRKRALALAGSGQFNHWEEIGAHFARGRFSPPRCKILEADASLRNRPERQMCAKPQQRGPRHGSQIKTSGKTQLDSNRRSASFTAPAPQAVEAPIIDPELRHRARAWSLSCAAKLPEIRHTGWGYRLFRDLAAASGVTRSTCETPNACESSYRVTIVGLRLPCSRSLMYCWLKPDRSSTCSWVSPFSRLMRAKVAPHERAHIHAACLARHAL
jgi:hypothetical protein